MPNTSFWDAPNRTTPAPTDRLGLQRGQPNAGEHITLAQVRDFTYEGVSGLTAKTVLEGTEELLIRDAGTSKKTTINALTGESVWTTFPVNLTRYTQLFTPLRYKKIGNRVWFSGGIVKSGTVNIVGGNNLVGDLPAGFRPNNQRTIALTSLNPVEPGTYVRISAFGQVEIVTPSLTLQNAQQYILEGLSFPVD